MTLKINWFGLLQNFGTIPLKFLWPTTLRKLKLADTEILDLCLWLVRLVRHRQSTMFFLHILHPTGAGAASPYYIDHRYNLMEISGEGQGWWEQSELLLILKQINHWSGVLRTCDAVAWHFTVSHIGTHISLSEIQETQSVVGLWKGTLNSLKSWSHCIEMPQSHWNCGIPLNICLAV